MKAEDAIRIIGEIEANKPAFVALVDTALSFDPEVKAAHFMKLTELGLTRQEALAMTIAAQNDVKHAVDKIAQPKKGYQAL